MRIAASIPVRISFGDQLVDCSSREMSSTGISIYTQGYWMPDQQVTIVFPEAQDYAPVRATVAGSSNGWSVSQELEQLRTITVVLYSNALRWKNWDAQREDDHILLSFLRILRHAMRGLVLATFYPLQGILGKNKSKSVAATSVLLAAMLSCSTHGQRPQGTRRNKLAMPR